MNPPAALSDAAPMMRAALVHHAEGRLAEAERLYRDILTRDPDHVRAVGMLALILSDGPDAAAAEAIILRHLSLCPNDGASLHRLGRLRTLQGRDEEAADLLARAAAALPGLAPIHNDLGVSLDRLGRRQEALAALERAAALDEGYAVAHCNRGFVLFEMGRFDEAASSQLMALARIAPDAAGTAPESCMACRGRRRRPGGWKPPKSPSRPRSTPAATIPTRSPNWPRSWSSPASSRKR